MQPRFKRGDIVRLIEFPDGVDRDEILLTKQFTITYCSRAGNLRHRYLYGLEDHAGDIMAAYERRLALYSPIDIKIRLVRKPHATTV